MRIVHEWLAEMVRIPGDAETVAREISLRGFEVANVENGVIDFEITANRPDCLCHVGIAREALVIWPQPAADAGDLTVELSFTQAPSADGEPRLTIEAPDLCPRYAAQIFDVQVAPSPVWLARRLEAAGVRPINNIVDVTNYVMLEMGQPMHAFDLERLAGGQIVVRRGRAGEALRTLDGVERALDPDMLVIADAARPVAIGGVMGGADSEVGVRTSRILLESAYFLPASVRRTSKRLGLKTEASTRFERGADIDAPLDALWHAADLFKKIGAATAGPARDLYPAPRPQLELVLRASRIARVLGVEVRAEEVPRILTALGFWTEPRDEHSWKVLVPSFRIDVTREIDLIEEVGRHVGFDRLPATFPVLTRPQQPPDDRIARDCRIRTLLTAAGLSESMTFAFIERTAAEPFCPPGFAPATIANPLSEKFAVLRPSMLPGLVDSASHNRRRGRRDVRLFETGSRFTSVGETRAAGLVWTGAGADGHWSAGARPVDFYDVKGVVDLVCSMFQLGDVTYGRAEASHLVPGRAAVARSGQTEIASFGQLLPSLADRRGLPPGEDVYVAEIDIDALAARTPSTEPRVEALPRFPASVRDLSILVDEALPAADVRGTIRAAAPGILQSVVEFDRYAGKGIPPGRVSLSLRLTFRSLERTLTDEEVDAAMSSILAALARTHAAERR